MIFVSIDEEWVTDAKRLTEAGVAILDTRAVRGIDPGENACNWLPHIRALNYKIPTNARPACVPPEGISFLFGRSQTVDRATLKVQLARLFEEYGPDRTYVLVGHSVDQDIDVLISSLHFDPYALPHVVGQIDTNMLVSGTSLQKSLSALYLHLHTRKEYFARRGSHMRYKLPGWHCAGNDAYYTLQLLLMLALVPQSTWDKWHATTRPMTKLRGQKIDARTAIPGLVASLGLSRWLKRGILKPVYR